jgi:hypothetical protein
MRTLLKMSMPVESANAAIRNGSLSKMVESTLDQLKPEAAYFFAEGGRRTALIVFDLKSPEDIPSIAEPLFMGVNASVEFTPVMNREDLRAGLEKALQAV